MSNIDIAALEERLRMAKLSLENASWRMGDKYRAEIRDLEKQIADAKAAQAE